MTNSKYSANGFTPEFSNFLVEFFDQIQNITDIHLEEYDIHQAFVYLIADLFETTDEDHFKYTDGAKDGGIDFFVQDYQVFSIYQCKCPTPETLETSNKPPKFDRSPLQELISAIRMLKDNEGSYDVKPEIGRLRSDFQRDFDTDSESTVFIATLAILGELTPQAQKAFTADKEVLRDEGVTLNLISWHDIYKRLHELDRPMIEDMKIDLYFDDMSKELLRHRDYCYLLAHAADFYDAWREYEWNLFDWNVRLQLTRSQINKRIVNSLSKPKTRKIFHHLNNGILITCNSYRIDKTRGRIRINGPQIINGCQSVTSIRDAFEDLSPAEQEEFRDQVRIQVKVIRTVDLEFIGQMVITTNDQNPMSPRNLKSNSSEQKDLQNQFRALPKKYFFERKDGEWKSLLSASSRVRWFRPLDYSVPSKGRTRYRVIDNNKVAKVWYSSIGFSNEALKGGFNYFEDDDVYNQTFRSKPKAEFWMEYSSNPYFTPNEDFFEPGIPSVYQYLLAITVSEFIGLKRISWRKNREQAIKFGIEQGKLDADPDTGAVISSQREIDEFLATDPEYRLNVIINNIRDILIELFIYVISQKYGSLNPMVCKKILSLKDVTPFISNAFSSEFAPMEQQKGNEVFGPIYAFLNYCMKQFYFENKAELMAAPRLKAYFFNRRVVHKLRDSIILNNKEIVDYDRPWKKAEVSFIESLPDL